MADDVARGPEAMREATRGYVWTLHATYLDHARHLPPAERAALPMIAADGFTVVAAASRRLHLVATPQRLPDPQGPEVEVADDYAGASWRLRFFDPSVLPELGTLADDTPQAVRQVLGITDTVYHLSVSPGGGLSEHHAQHSGVALANDHAGTWRDLEQLRHRLPRQSGWIDELAACVRLGLDRSAALLASDLTAGRVALADRPAAESLGAVLADVRG